MAIEFRYILNNLTVRLGLGKVFPSVPSYYDPPKPLPIGDYYQTTATPTAPNQQPKLDTLAIARTSPTLLQTLAGLKLGDFTLYSLRTNTYVGRYNEEGRYQKILHVRDLEIKNGQLVSPAEPRSVIALMEGRALNDLPSGTILIGTNGYDYVLCRDGAGRIGFQACQENTPPCGSYFGLPLEVIAEAMRTTPGPRPGPYRR